jgi:predicted nuclease of predicted toxin-antitoxin system
MIVWVDAQLSPHLAPWISENIPEITSLSVKYLGLRDAEDLEIWKRAKSIGEPVWILTKDDDFIDIQHRYGSPPNIIWLTCGNTTNENLKRILFKQQHYLLDLLKTQEPLIEISD